jgi:hypothetical protein
MRQFFAYNSTRALPRTCIANVAGRLYTTLIKGWSSCWEFSLSNEPKRGENDDVRFTPESGHLPVAVR